MDNPNFGRDRRPCTATSNSRTPDPGRDLRSRLPEVTGVRGSTVGAHLIPQGTCVQNSRIILGKYLNVKLITYNYSGKREEHESREV